MVRFGISDRPQREKETSVTSKKLTGAATCVDTNANKRHAETQRENERV